jgi:hypothetical protein
MLIWNVHDPKTAASHAGNYAFLRYRDQVFFRDHPPPHFHAEYAGMSAVYDIETLEITEGSLPRTAGKLVVEWATLHKESLLQIWETQEFIRLPPLE